MTENDKKVNPDQTQKRGPDAVDIHVGSRLKILRTQRGQKMSAVAEAAGLSFQQIQKYELGTNRISASRLYKIANFLQTDANYFFEGLKGYDPDDTGIKPEEIRRRQALEMMRIINQLSEKQTKALILLGRGILGENDD